MGDTSDNGLGVAVGEAFSKTLAREVKALEDHLRYRGTLQIGRVRYNSQKSARLQVHLTTQAVKERAEWGGIEMIDEEIRDY